MSILRDTFPVGDILQTLFRRGLLQETDLQLPELNESTPNH